MDNKRVKDLMVPLDEYAVVSDQATLLDAVTALEEAQKNLPPGRQPYRAVLVVGSEGKIIGKIGQLAFLNALEPKFNVLGDLGKLAVAGVSSEFISQMTEHFRFFQDNLSDLCQRAGALHVKDVMHPVTDSIDENASLGDAINRLVALQTLSLLVQRRGEMVGLLRLSDLFDEVTREMKQQHST